MVPLYRRISSHFFSKALWLSYLALSGSAHAQVLGVDQQIEVTNLPSIASPSSHSSDVLITALATIIHDPEICCGKDSALEDSVQRADTKSLQDVAAKLTGRHLLSDGRPIMIDAEFFSPDKMSAGYLVTTMTAQRAGLMEWNSHIYILHGLIYFWNQTGSTDVGGAIVAVAHKFLLWDTRYSDSRREVIFNRDTDDLAKVQSFLFVQVKPQ